MTTDQTDHRADPVQAVAEALDKNFNPDRYPVMAAMFMDYAVAAVAAARPAIEREAKAEAWDEGFSWGWSDAQEAHDVPQEMDRGDWLLCMPNPYRIEREGQA